MLYLSYENLSALTNVIPARADAPPYSEHKKADPPDKANSSLLKRKQKSAKGYAITITAILSSTGTIKAEHLPKSAARLGKHNATKLENVMTILAKSAASQNKNLANGYQYTTSYPIASFPLIKKLMF